MKLQLSLKNNYFFQIFGALGCKNLEFCVPPDSNFDIWPTHGPGFPPKAFGWNPNKSRKIVNFI